MMHKYILKLTRYSEAGALTSDVQFLTADSAQALSDLRTKYDRMRYQTVDDEGNIHVGMKMYEVMPMQGEYVSIADWEMFCTVNAVLR